MEASKWVESVCVGIRGHWFTKRGSLCQVSFLILELVQGLCVNFRTCGNSHRKSGSSPKVTLLAPAWADLECSLTHAPWHYISWPPRSVGGSCLCGKFIRGEELSWMVGATFGEVPFAPLISSSQWDLLSTDGIQHIVYIYFLNGLLWDFFIYFHWFSQKSLKVDEEIKALERRRDFGKIYVFVIAKPTSHPWGVVSDTEMMAPVSQDSTEHSSCDRGAGHGEALWGGSPW